MAKALDVIGDRWTMLILRELSLGPKRFTDLAERLSGIAPNLLSARLKHLQHHDVITKRRLDPPAASQVYDLTSTGHELEPALLDLARWGTRFLGPIEEGESFQLDWLLPVLEEMADREAAIGLFETYEFRIDGATFHVSISDGDVTVRSGPSPAPPDLKIDTDIGTFMKVGFEAITVDEAKAQGLGRIEGDPAIVERALNILSPSRVLSNVRPSLVG
jgi:DNA-binding HxlR family transcriptional regulator